MPGGHELAEVHRVETDSRIGHVSRALVAWWQSRLGLAERTILGVIVDRYPAAVTKEEISAASGYSITSSSFANALGKLRTLELISGRGELRASEDLFS